MGGSDMKKRIFIISLLACVALTLSARVFDGSEVIYVSKYPSNWSWYGDDLNAGKFAYFFNSETSANAWSTEMTGVYYCDDVFQVKVPAGDWTHVILTRNSVHSAPNWSNVYSNGDDNNVNKSAEIVIPSDKNYIDNFRKLKEANENPLSKWYWKDHYFYRPSDDPTSVIKIGEADIEVVEVCTQSSGDPFSLQPRLISPTEGYDYDQGHTWFKWDGATWKELENANSNWGFDGSSGLSETIGAVYSHTYYFLSTADHSKQRFIEMAVTKDCSPTCEITDFGVVTSNVNIHDSTYVLDGIVAFKDATGKTLRISVTDEKGEHHIDTVSPKTPLIFSLPGLFANGASGITATASFLGTEYSRTSAPYTVPDAIYSVVNIDTINKTHGESTTIVPDDFDSHLSGLYGFKWHDGNTTEHERYIPAYNFDTAIVYTYYEYEELPKVGGNLITNGDFSSTTFDYGTINYDGNITVPPYSTISQYHYWGKDVTSTSDFYSTSPHINITGGMAIVQDANEFWKRYTKKIISKTGNHFALFDADNSGEKAAWIVETNPTTQPNLKLAKGANYMFSFWVANINNYGEMNNAAILQFEISYSTDGGATWSTPEKLGNPIDLNDYPDNLWHQNSYVYVATEDADKVRISVKDLNTNSNPVGNDFALDDIIFQPISVKSQAIKYWHRFVVKNYEDTVVVEKPQITITKTPSCGNTDFEMQVKVDYSTLNNKYQIHLLLTDDIYGNIFASPIEIDPAVNPNSITLTLPTATYSMLVADGKKHKLTATIIREDGKHNNKGGSNSNTYTAPGVPAMNIPILEELNKANDKTSFDLEVVTQYKAFKGNNLHYEWDGAEWTDVTIHSLSYKESAWQTVKDTLHNLIADGLSHTLRVYSDNILDCEYSFPAPAPYMPFVTVSTPEIQTYSCGEPTYSVKVSASFTNGQMHDIIFKDWKTGIEQHVTTSNNDDVAEYIFTGYTWDATPEIHEYNVYFDGASGSEHKKSYTSPAQPALDATPSYTDTGCDIMTYTLQLNLTYTNQRGSTFYASVDGGTPVAVANPNAGAQMEKNDVTLNITDLPADGKGHTYSVWTDETKDCALTDVAFTAPYGPQITNATATVLPYACSDANYQVKVAVDFANAQTHNLIIEDWNGNRQIIPTADTDIHAEYTFTYVWEAPATHAYKVFFQGNETCQSNHMPSFTAPAEPKIEIKTVSLTPVTACYVTTYDMTVTFDYYNQDGIFSADVDGTPASSISPALEINSQEKKTATASFSGLPADGGTAHVVTVQTTGGAHNCLAYQTLTGVQHLPIINSVAQDYVPDFACGDPQYNVTLTVNYTNALGATLFVKEGSTVLASATANAGAGTFDTPIQLSFDFATDHNLMVYFEGREDCAEPISVTSPAKPKVTVTSSVVNTACDKTTYDLDVTIKYTNQDGTLSVEVDGVSADPTTLVFTPNSAAENTLVAKVKDLPADGADTHVLNVAFSGGAHSCAVAPMTVTAPYGPQITNATATVLPYACSDANYQVKVAVDFANAQTHNLIIEDWNGNRQIIPTADTDIHAEYTFTYVWEAPATHAYKVFFQGNETCQSNHMPSFTAPFSPVIDAVAVTGVPETILCDEMSYNVNVAVYTPFDATGKDIVLSYEGTSTTIPASGTVTNATLTMTYADITGLTVSAAYAETPAACAAISDTYDTPTRLSCFKDEATVCEGESYTWPYNGAIYGPFNTVGKDTVTNAANIHDTLIVNIHAEPSVSMLPIEIMCADENQIRLPFTVTSGYPNLFEVTIDGQSFSYSYESTDTIQLNRPASIPAGTYTASITVRDSLISCFSTTQTSFTIAQADVMYRKWDDLIFIDNSENLYTAYQWFENGTALSQETNQYLYNPSGLSGMYYCRMITTNGETIYTCEQAFDDIPRSRDFTSDAPQNITVSPTYVRANGLITIRQTADMNLNITLYDATGKMLGQHTQVSAEDVIFAPMAEGIYFVRVQYGEDVTTTKIIVHE